MPLVDQFRSAVDVQVGSAREVHRQGGRHSRREGEWRTILLPSTSLRRTGGFSASTERLFQPPPFMSHYGQPDPGFTVIPGTHQESIRTFQMQPGEKVIVGINDVPDQAKQQIRNALTNRRIPVTDQAIIDEYRKLHTVAGSSAAVGWRDLSHQRTDPARWTEVALAPHGSLEGIS